MSECITINGMRRRWDIFVIVIRMVRTMVEMLTRLVKNCFIGCRILISESSSSSLSSSFEGRAREGVDKYNSTMWNWLLPSVERGRRSLAVILKRHET